MAALVVDTNIWIEFFRGRSVGELENALAESRVVLSPLVAAELLSGQLSRLERERLDDFLQELPLHEISFSHWAAVGKLRSQLAEQGLSVSVPDAHVAQCALDVDGYLLTLDRIFKSIASRTKLKLLHAAG